MNTTTKKANATLAAELKRLGFRRGIAVWEKSNFTKTIHQDSKEGGFVEIAVRIRSDWDAGWVIESPRIETKRWVGNTLRLENGSVDLGSDATSELVNTLSALGDL